VVPLIRAEHCSGQGHVVATIYTVRTVLSGVTIFWGTDRIYVACKVIACRKLINVGTKLIPLNLLLTA
jgi:hypothetical protein